MINNTDRKVIANFKQELTQKDFDESSSEMDMSLTELSKANILELRALSKPNSMVEKTLQIVCALKGFKNLSWATAKDLLARATFKMELKQTSYMSLKSDDVFRA